MKQPSVTIVLPVSRDFLLDRIFVALEFLTCDREATNIIAVVDGDASLFIKTRNLVTASKFNQKLCVQYKEKHKLRKYDKGIRRKRIAAINNMVKEYMWDSEYIFGIEDDGLFPANTLQKLLSDYNQYPFAGIIEGVELGRWGIPYVGAWKVDSIYEPKRIESIRLPSEPSLIEIDAGGFYCYLTLGEYYMSHEFKTWQEGKLGPDVNYGIELRKRGSKNYIDTSIICDHYIEKTGQVISPRTYKPRQVIINKKENGRWYGI